MPKIKICGLKRWQDIEYVNETKPEYIGFVFAKSKRQVSKEQAQELKRLLNPDIKAVGVFVDAPLEEMVGLVKENIIDVIQLHGQETNVVIEELKRKVKAPIIQVFSIKTKLDLHKINESVADYILLDGSKAGSGQKFDWNLADNLTAVNKPFFLAGGISSDNVQAALEQFTPYAIDVSSGVEEDGYKNKEKIDALIGRVRNV